MPPAMVAYGKTWSPTCWNNIEQRWPELVAAVQALGTSGGGGTRRAGGPPDATKTEEEGGEQGQEAYHAEGSPPE